MKFGNSVADNIFIIKHTQFG